RPPARPHPRPAGAAAESVITPFSHLDDADAGDAVQHVPRFVVHVVVSSQVARIVVRQELEYVSRGSEPPLSDQFLEELAVMDDLIRPSKLGVLVLDRV